MRYDFREIMGLEEDVSSLLHQWPEWKEKLIALAKAESATRQKFATIIRELDKSKEDIAYEDGKMLSADSMHAHEVNTCIRSTHD